MKRTKQEVVSEFRCAEILESARRTFAAKGFHAATMDEIAETAGVAKGTLYLYFDSKRTLYLKALEHGLSQLLELTTAKMQAAKGIRAKIRAFVGTRLEYAVDNRDFFRIYAESCNVAEPGSINKDFQKLYTRQINAVAHALSEAVDRGEIRPLPVQAAAFTIYDMTRGLIVRHLLDKSKTAIEEDIKFVCEFIWAGIGK
jgi:AcrR family transcriptional regulator